MSDNEDYDETHSESESGSESEQETIKPFIKRIIKKGKPKFINARSIFKLIKTSYFLICTRK